MFLYWFTWIESSALTAFSWLCRRHKFASTTESRLSAFVVKQFIRGRFLFLLLLSPIVDDRFLFGSVFVVLVEMFTFFLAVLLELVCCSDETFSRLHFVILFARLLIVIDTFNELLNFFLLFLIWLSLFVQVERICVVVASRVSQFTVLHLFPSGNAFLSLVCAGQI